MREFEFDPHPVTIGMGLAVGSVGAALGSAAIADAAALGSAIGNDLLAAKLRRRLDLCARAERLQVGALLLRLQAEDADDEVQRLRGY